MLASPSDPTGVRLCLLSFGSMGVLSCPGAEEETPFPFWISATSASHAATLASYAWIMAGICWSTSALSAVAVAAMPASSFSTRGPHTSRLTSFSIVKRL